MVAPTRSPATLLNPLPLLMHPQANFRKLATREDRHHIHKTLGILSVMSFVYRYGVVYPATGSLGFSGAPFDWATKIVHTLLAFSSILFRVPPKRIADKPMVIYEEYRQHAMVFTHRCLVVYAAAIFFPAAPAWVVPVLVAAHHLAADWITSRHGTQGNTAVRSTSDRLKTSSFYKRVGLLYSYYQFLAIASHITPSRRLADMGYNAIIAIASSAFMMTLYRKKIIRGRTHMVVYSFCLALSAFHIVRVMGSRVAILAALVFIARIKLRVNKYLLWGIYLGTIHLMSDFFLESRA